MNDTERIKEAIEQIVSRSASDSVSRSRFVIRRSSLASLSASPMTSQIASGQRLLPPARALQAAAADHHLRLLFDQLLVCLGNSLILLICMCSTLFLPEMKSLVICVNVVRDVFNFFIILGGTMPKRKHKSGATKNNEIKPSESTY
jgi:hypothetical protein